MWLSLLHFVYEGCASFLFNKIVTFKKKNPGSSTSSNLTFIVPL
jgi:hypothetical protein